mgnify:CR=1 FL=1|tara:strand:+ start:69332 stop:70303 length:972 start_codon:yes stop_codon:yes gene_type:complete
MDYKSAGVDIDLGDQFVKNIIPMVKRSFNQNVKNDLTSFSAVYDIGPFYLTACTDGVGTKVMLAMETGIHNTIGQDLVAMNVNDLICNGSRPIFFLDYIACHGLELEKMQNIVHGMNEACLKAGCALIGGETAEMNDLYQENHYDLAGFSVGMVEKDKLINGEKVQVGDKLIAIKANGFHSNGYSLVRRLIKEDEIDLKKALLTPTPIYVPTIMNLLEAAFDDIHGIANITGGGLYNIERINKNFKYIINNPFAISTLPIEMQTIIKRAELDHHNLYKTFNMGQGMVICINASAEKRIQKLLSDLSVESKVIGHVEAGSGVEY